MEMDNISLEFEYFKHQELLTLDDENNKET